MIIDRLTQTIQLKICYFGPALSGKTTTMKALFNLFGISENAKFKNRVEKNIELSFYFFGLAVIL